VPAHRCGYVVPDDTDPRRIFVVEVEPPEPTDLSPVLETGTDLGMTPGYGGLAPIAQRTGRRVVIVDLPGTGHSTPSLDCPEVEALGDPAAHPDGVESLAAAIEECRSQVEAAGADPSQLTPERLGADLVAVMTALGDPRWVVMGHGTTAEAGRQAVLADPERVEALVLDSTVEERDSAGQVERVVADVASACQADEGCRTTYGDIERTWRHASQRLARRPVVVDVSGTSVRIDAEVLARGVRWLVAPTSLGPGHLPALLAEAASGTSGTWLQLFAQTLSAAPPLCVGYLPKCEQSEKLNLGAVLSAVCPELADETAWSVACTAWGIPRGPAAVTPLRGVPTLALYGAFDPFASADLIRRVVAERVPDAYLVEHASGGHNVLGAECPRLVRNAWLGDVTEPPAVDPCLSAPPAFDLSKEDP